MGGILTTFVIVIGIIVCASIINEKKLHFPHDIALLLVSFLIGAVILGLEHFNLLPFKDVILNVMKNVKLDTFVLECALGFIMFASASKIHLTKFVKNLLPIGVLSVITTFVSSMVYGGLFFLASLVLKLNVGIGPSFVLRCYISVDRTVSCDRKI
jgi:NhaP-type Na+/H+ or K+/H+ antiporter